MTRPLPGKIFELNERVFVIDQCFYDDDGELECVTAKCISVAKDEPDNLYTIQLPDPTIIRAHTLQ